jgi:hypothetical protein
MRELLGIAHDVDVANPSSRDVRREHRKGTPIEIAEDTELAMISVMRLTRSGGTNFLLAPISPRATLSALQWLSPVFCLERLLAAGGGGHEPRQHPEEST